MPEPKDDKMVLLSRFSGIIVTLIAWVRIFISPTIVLSVLGGLVFLYLGRTNVGAILWACFVILGMAWGAVWAERVRRGVGLVAFHSRLIATPELDRAARNAQSNKGSQRD